MNLKRITGVGGLGDVKVKQFLNRVLDTELEPIRAERAKWENNINEIVEILHIGTKKAQKKAAETLQAVKEAMHIDYFGKSYLGAIANLDFYIVK